MARRRKGNPVHGWLVLDKPTGMTSTRALAIAKRVFNAQKAGHAGTLDPLATGILPIAFGEATKTTSYAVDGTKTYRFRVAWGVERTTDDSEGDVVETSEQRPSGDEIDAALSTFSGAIEQVPPQFSAIKVQGERAYDVARDGRDVVLTPRSVHIDSFKRLDSPTADTAQFEVTCGKGTYVRALARDLGRALGCLGHVTALRRTRVGPFYEHDAVALDTLQSEVQSAEALATLLRPIEAALGDLAELRVDPSEAAQLARGQSVLIRGQQAPDPTKPVYAVSKGRVIALGEIAQGALKPFRVFHYAK